MADVQITNTTSGISGKGVLLKDSDATVTALHTFDRGSGSAPFAAGSGAAKVANLDADKVDGVDISTLAANRIPYASDAATLTNSSSFTFDGTTLTVPGQIAFPATQSASSGANTLDDYKENSYVPTWTNGAIVDGAVGAVYLKIGQNVQVWMTLTMGASSTFGAGSAWTFSLPFTAANINVNFYGTAQAKDSSANTLYPAIASIAAAGTTLTLNVSGVNQFFTNAIPFTGLCVMPVPLSVQLFDAFLGGQEGIHSIILPDIFSSGGSQNLYIDKYGRAKRILGYDNQNASR
jgi:hypothetical protein